MKKMAAGSFKTNCLAIMDEVQSTRETVVITKHGKPVAKLVPVTAETDDIYNFLAGKGAVAGEVVSPAISPKEWGKLEVILADTHVVVWLAFDQERISRRARAAIDDSRKNADGLAISDITLLELATLASKGRIRLDISLESFLRKSNLGSLFCRSRAEHAPAPWDFLRAYPQGSSRSHHRGHCSGRRAIFAYRRP